MSNIHICKNWDVRLPYQAMALLFLLGGEYDDFYDPDFLIYNDVIVKYDDGSVKHFGYPEDVFPCTDFHTAIYYSAHNCIYIIGSIGYADPLKVRKDTSVFKLDLQTFAISKVDYQGTNPGWIHNNYNMNNMKLKGSKVWVTGHKDKRKKEYVRKKVFTFDLETRTWEKKNLWKKLKLT